MKKMFILFLTFLFISTLSFSQDFKYEKDYPRLYKQSQEEGNSQSYKQLKESFLIEGEDFSNEELLALLVGQTAQKSYNAYGMVGLERSFLGAEQFPADTIFKYGKLVSEINPVSLALNYGLWKSYQKSKNTPMANVYENRFNLLCETILSSGDGSKQNPYFVISPIDGTIIISKYLGKEITQMGSGEDANGYFLDILSYKTESGDQTLHFVIDHGMGGLSKILMEINEGTVEEDR
ncbi:DUF4919 domain-containing protein [Algoriphagus mannitolivorans]|uniref:DUF4919 domain-containing protein n=1 Tax=Algoriphagus mannitolivorans TaxID=226504 RepID=UPI000409131E|nr:DUF4919 domain-containing protein [Algoriphagus mannitolivorans]